LGELFEVDPYDIKLVHKGKILKRESSAETAKLSSATVMVVVNQPKEAKKVGVGAGRKSHRRTRWCLGLG
jgi:hypothetical protein